MCSVIAAIRMPPDMLEELKTLAMHESLRRGEVVSWAKLVRESAARLLEQDETVKQGASGRRATG
jgi:hypothetical protein